MMSSWQSKIIERLLVFELQGSCLDVEDRLERVGEVGQIPNAAFGSACNWDTWYKACTTMMYKQPIGEIRWWKDWDRSGSDAMSNGHHRQVFVQVPPLSLWPTFDSANVWYLVRRVWTSGTADLRFSLHEPLDDGNRVECTVDVYVILQEVSLEDKGDALLFGNDKDCIRVESEKG